MVRDPAGDELGTVRDVYRAGGGDVLDVAGGPRGDFDVPIARPFVRILAPRRGEIVVDPEALDLPPVEEIRPPRPPRPPRPRRATRRRPAVPMAPRPGPEPGHAGQPPDAGLPAAGAPDRTGEGTSPPMPLEAGGAPADPSPEA